MTNETNEILLPKLSENKGDFVPPPIPENNDNSNLKKSSKNPKVSDKALYITAISVLAAVVIGVAVLLIVSNNRPNNYSVNSDNDYSSTSSSLKEGEVFLRDSDGNIYSAQIDEDYYNWEYEVFYNGIKREIYGVGLLQYISFRVQMNNL